MLNLQSDPAFGRAGISSAAMDPWPRITCRSRWPSTVTLHVHSAPFDDVPIKVVRNFLHSRGMGPEPGPLPSTTSLGGSTSSAMTSATEVGVGRRVPPSSRRSRVLMAARRARSREFAMDALPVAIDTSKSRVSSSTAAQAAILARSSATTCWSARMRSHAVSASRSRAAKSPSIQAIARLHARR